MARTDDIARIQACIRNTLDPDIIKKRRIAGIIGDLPSRYAKSPALWNAVFRALKMKAVYVPLDVDESRLPELARALKKSDRLLGTNVTVPHKVTIMEYLDALDERAEQIKAVNTIVRTADGKLIGTNTDGRGFLESILTPRSGQEKPFVESLKGSEVLIIGAGGAARAVAFSLAGALGHGRLVICNRTRESASSLAEEIKKIFPNTRAIDEADISDSALKAHLIINGSIKGQGGIRKTPDGKMTILEPYSALAPANPATIPESEYGKPEFYRAWLRASLADIEANNRASLNLATSIPLATRFCDLVYYPEESVFLRHGRLSGHRTLNGKGMIVAQAAEAFFHNVCREYLKKMGLHNRKTYRRIVEIMHEAW